MIIACYFITNGFLTETLGITLFADFQCRIDVDFQEMESRCLMVFPSSILVLFKDDIAGDLIDDLVRQGLRNGETNEHKVTTPDSAQSLATLATRWMFSRSPSENLRSEFKPNRMVSPKSPNTGIPLAIR